MCLFNGFRYRPSRAGIPGRGRNLGQRLNDANAEVNFGHRGNNLVPRLYARNRSKLIARLRVAKAASAADLLVKAASAADHNIEAGRQAIPIVARLRMATCWNGMAPEHGTGHLVRRPLALGRAVLCRLLFLRRGQHRGFALGLRWASGKTGSKTGSQTGRERDDDQHGREVAERHGALRDKQ